MGSFRKAALTASHLNDAGQKLTVQKNPHLIFRSIDQDN